METDEVQCATCHNLIQNNSTNQWYSEENRKKIGKICLAQLFSELIDSSTIWRVYNEESSPFCDRCLKEFEKISKMDDECENVQKKIDDFVDGFTMKVLRFRKSKDKFELSETAAAEAETARNELIQNSGKEFCKMCLNEYMSVDPDDQLEMETIRKILAVCEKHFVKELISKDCFDWNSIGLNKFLAFCSSCFENIKVVCEMNDDVDTAAEEVSTAVEKFIITLLKSRKSVKEKGNNSYYGLDSSIETKHFLSPVWKSPTLTNYCPTSDSQTSKDESQMLTESEMTENPQFIISNPRSLSSELNEGDKYANSPGISREMTLKQTRMLSAVEYNEILVPQKSPIANQTVLVRPKMTPTIKLKRLFPTTDVKTIQGTSAGDGQRKKSRIPKPLRDPVYEWNVKRYKAAKKPVIRINGISTTRKTKIFNAIIKCEKCPKVFTYTKSYQKHVRICPGKKNFAESQDLKYEIIPVSPQKLENHSTVENKLENHNSTLKIKFGMPVAKFACKECGQAFMKKNHLSNHCRFKKHASY